MSILVKTVRINGFRGLQNTEVDLGLITVLTGMNNTGKTTFLKSLQIVLGNRMFISQDDFCISDHGVSKQVIIDVKIIPINANEEITDVFSEDWEILFTVDRIRTDEQGSSFLPLRTIVTFDVIKNTYKTKQYILQDWPLFENEGIRWFESENGTEKVFSFEEIPFFYMEAQRDIIEDMKFRTSYLGRMLSKIEYSEEEVERIEAQIKELNETAVSSSDILSTIRTTLKELDSAMESTSDGVEITPFTKKLRDLNKGLSIYYSDSKDSFSMEYHGMGTRSWSSLLTLKSFISVLGKKAQEEGEAFFPIIAIEEPEAHLHPNAQKKLYNQIAGIPGQKLISTHSTYIAAAAELDQIRNIYKGLNSVLFGRINTSGFDDEDFRKIKRQVINTRGEIFFSKVLVFFEGETEEQALPVFAEKYFGKTTTEMGIDFIGVGGSGNYLPFIRVASGLNIPWFILSDGEDATKKAVKKALDTLTGVNNDIDAMKNVFVLGNGYDFERTIIEEDYVEEILSAFTKLFNADYFPNQIHLKHGSLKRKHKTEEKCDKCSQVIMTEEFRDYAGEEGYKEALYDCMTSIKTSFGPIIAAEICAGEKKLPAKINELFEEIHGTVFKIEEKL